MGNFFWGPTHKKRRFLQAVSVGEQPSVATHALESVISSVLGFFVANFVDDFLSFLTKHLTNYKEQ